jgi:hypothetical protein
MRVYKRAREQGNCQLPIVYHHKDVGLLSTGLSEAPVSILINSSELCVAGFKLKEVFD